MPPVPPPKRHPYDQWSPDARALDLVGDKWTLLIIRDLAAGPRRFVELQRVLPGISTEQLRSRLNRMVADGLLTRQRYREVPPRVDYELTERSRELMPVLGALARWGYDWTWGSPRPGEDVNVGAIFRLAPACSSPPDGRRGHGRARGRRPRRAARAPLPAHAGGRPRRDHGAGAGRAEPDARVSGPVSAWVSALGPDGGTGELQFSRPPRARGRRARRASRGRRAPRRRRRLADGRRSYLLVAARRGAGRVVVGLHVRERALQLLAVERELVARVERVLVLHHAARVSRRSARASTPEFAQSNWPVILYLL